MSQQNSARPAGTDPEAVETGPDRRSLMKAAALIAVPVAGIGTVAACSGGGSSQPSKQAGANAGKIEVATADVPVGGGKVVSGIVVTQPEAGTYKAFTAICTHAGCTVKDVTQNQINCPCHGSTFSAQDGSVLGGPAPAPLTALTVTVSGANVDVTGMTS